MRNKIFTGIFVGFLLLSLASSFFYFPPASICIDLYLKFSGEKKYPIFLMGIIPVCIRAASRRQKLIRSK